MSRGLTPAEFDSVKATMDQVGPAPRHPPDSCPKCGSADFFLAYGTGLLGCCEALCKCGWSDNEVQREYVLKVRVAVKPVLAGFDPPVEQSADSDL